MFLEQIVSQTYMDVKQRKQELPLAEMMLRAAAQPPPRDLLAALRPGGTEERNSLRPNSSPISRNTSQIRLIAEVKRASPSKGLLVPHLDPVKLASGFAQRFYYRRVPGLRGASLGRRCNSTHLRNSQGQTTATPA